MPNPPKPTEQKRKTGNPGKRAMPKLASVVALPAANGVPTPARPLGVEGERMWVRVWSGGQSWVSPATDIEHVLVLCEAVDERDALRQLVLANGDWRDRVALRQLDSQILSQLSALGFNPVERTRLGLAEVKARSKFEELRERQRSV